MPDPKLRMTFNSVAPLYEEVRPGYPDDLVSDVIALSGLPEDGAILDIGCGTGQATRPFASRGYSVLCLDIGAEMISVARSALADFPQVEFEVAPFEEWRTDRTFDLVISATAFRWLDPMIRYAKVASILGPNGSLAVFSHRHIRNDVGFFAEVQQVYRQHVPEWFQPTVSGKSQSPAAPEPGLDSFLDPVRRRYQWNATYSANQYVNLLNTYSDHVSLRPEQKEMLFHDTVDLINRVYEGHVTKEYETVLELRKRKN